MKTTLLLTLLALSIIFHKPLAFAATIITDSTFNPDDWTASVIAVTGGASQSNQQSGAGGDPGAYRMMTHTLPGQSSIIVFHQFLGVFYDPTAQGPIISLDYIENHIEINPPFVGAAIAGAPALLQSGVVFLGPNFQFTSTEWTSESFSGLTASDFSPLGSPSSHPNFTATGAPISFGFMRANSTNSTGGHATQSGIDNWSVTVVPEPTSALLLLCGVSVLISRRMPRSNERMG